MGKKSHQVPNAEWVLMYRRGLTRTRIARLVGVPPSTVGYHLAAAKSGDAGLNYEHEAHALHARAARATAGNIARVNELFDFVTTEGRYPSSKATTPAERTLGLWLLRCRHKAAEGSLSPVFREGLQALPEWEANTRALAEESRWQERLVALIDYRAKGEDWPRHKNTATVEEHALGVWLHRQRFKHARGELHHAKKEALDAALSGWREGRRRGRRASSKY